MPSKSEDYLLIVTGPRNYCSFLTDWQAFKDNLRGIVDDQPGWTEVMSGPGRGQMQGWCKLNKRKDADAAYGYYTQTGRGVLAHLFKTSRSNTDYRLLTCNCSPHFPDIKHGHSPHRSGMDAGIVNKHMSSKLTGSREPQYVPPAAPVYAYSAYPQQPSVYITATGYPTPAPAVQYMVPQMPVYSTNTSGMPVNMSSGAVLTESRGIFISGLNYKARSRDLEALLNTVGRPLEFKLQKDKNGRSKGSATAKFASTQEAQVAVSRLNGIQHMDKSLSVRLDTEKTVVGQVQSPVIVNGSTTYAR